MESLNLISSVVEILLYMALVTALVFVIVYFRRIAVSTRNIENQINRIASDAAPVFKEMSSAAADIKDLTFRSKTQFYKVEHLVGEISGQAENFISALKTAGNVSGNIIRNGNNFLTSLGSGLRAFKRKYN